MSTQVSVHCKSFLSGKAHNLNSNREPAPVPPPVYAPPAFSWTEFCLGGNIGVAWAYRDIVDTRFGLDFGHASDGVFIGGGQLGYNYQTGNFVFRVEGTSTRSEITITMGSE